MNSKVANQELPPIYTVPRDSDEYESRRNKQHERGLETFLEAVVIFGGALILYLFITWVF